MNKIIALSALSALTFSTNAYAGRGIALDSIIVSQDTVRVQYGLKIRDCGLLIDDDGYRAQAKPFMFCEQGGGVSATFPYEAVNFVAGDVITMCAAHNSRNCTDSVEVRAAGDVNGDGALNVLDLMIMHDTASGIELDHWPANNTDELAADMNDDGDINVIDILQLIEAMRAEW